VGFASSRTAIWLPVSLFMAFSLHLVIQGSGSWRFFRRSGGEQQVAGLELGEAVDGSAGAGLLVGGAVAASESCCHWA
jgi:hypothetical protein